MSITTVAIVTGASKGLGQALAQGLLGPNVHLISVARGVDAQLAAKAALTSCTLQHVQADLSDPASLNTVIQPVIAALPRTASRYLLINNAGMVTPIGQAPSLDNLLAINQAFALNVSSVIALTALFLQATQGLDADRRVLNISSGAGRGPTPGWGVYCATKAALDMYTQVVQAENHDVRIVALAPGVIDTDMQSTIRGTQTSDFPNVDRFVQMHQHGQLASATTIANAILTYMNSADFGTTVLDDIRRHF
ncbi:MAG: SDR family NAD(P)-dependent oxidoreductase [Burkholderiaceae bacterium]|nr:SDR family NAD(P)-dependent oxidoreductase [Burkholderiaceae bacterium]